MGKFNFLNYHGQGRILRFTNQILTTPMSQGGDSGSLVLDESETLTERDTLMGKGEVFTVNTNNSIERSKKIY